MGSQNMLRHLLNRAATGVVPTSLTDRNRSLFQPGIPLRFNGFIGCLACGAQGPDYQLRTVRLMISSVSLSMARVWPSTSAESAG